MADAAVLTSVETVQKWHALAERRRSHYVELYRSERWKRYFAEDVFVTQMRAAVKNVDAFAKTLERMGHPVQAAKAA